MSIWIVISNVRRWFIESRRLKHSSIYSTNVNYKDNLFSAASVNRTQATETINAILSMLVLYREDYTQEFVIVIGWEMLSRIST